MRQGERGEKEKTWVNSVPCARTAHRGVERWAGGGGQWVAEEGMRRAERG
jgi:hypothetical protein